MIENFRPGTLEKWGLAPTDLLATNPRLVVCRMSGYVQTGSYAQRTGFGLIGEAMVGWRHIVGDPDRPASRIGVSIGNSLCATYGCLGILAALESRHRTGHGQIIDSSLYETALQVMESLVIDYSVTGYIRERTGAILPGIAPSNVYPCKDGYYLIGGNNDAVFARLCEAMGLPGLATDARFSTHRARGRHQADLDLIVAGCTAARTVDEVEATMVAHAIPAGRSYKAPDMLADPHFKARRSIIDVEHPRYGSVKMQGVFPQLSETPASVRRLAPAFPGQDNRAVFAEVLGICDEEMDALTTAGAI